MKTDETVEKTAIREAGEELGLEDHIEMKQIKIYHKYTRDHRHVYHLVATHFTNNNEEIVITPQEKEFIVGAIWIDPHKLLYSLTKPYSSFRKKMSAPGIKAIETFLHTKMVSARI
jgi:ADP-ribose pyrophosphatase YjhB (NUDIX family)